MRLVTFFCKIVFCLFLVSGCGGTRSKAARIGVDSAWYPLDFGAQNSYVNGFCEEMLLELAKQTGIEFERVGANWDALFDGLKKGSYQAVLSSLPPFEHYAAQYDFSDLFLEAGPVLILPEDAQQASLADMNGRHVGIITGDQTVLLLQKYDGIIVRNFQTAPELLEAVVNGDIEGALLGRVAAGSYVSDLFFGKLKISGEPLNEAGLRLVVLKGRQTELLKKFNRGLASMKKKKQLSSLFRKWQLGEPA